jgi:hypothetical protein
MTPKVTKRPERREPPDGGDAFIPDPRRTGVARTRESLAELVGEQFVASATSAEERFEETVNEPNADEELGGPFVEVEAATEYDLEPDASNPPDAEPAPFPSAVRVP